MHRISPPAGILLLLAIGVVWAPGCRRCGQLPTYRVEGKVTFRDGKAMPGGWVEFKPVGSKHLVSTRGQIPPAGTFRLGSYQPRDGAIQGEHLAVIIPHLQRTPAAKQ